MNYRGGQAEFKRHGGRAAEGVDDAVSGNHEKQFALNENRMQAPFAVKVVARNNESAQNDSVLSETELKASLKALVDAGQIEQNDIAAVLKASPAAVTRLFQDDRRIKLDEAKDLIERFNLGRPAITPLSVSVARLLILYAAETLGVPLKADDPRVEDLAQDFRAFSRFATDPRVRENADSAAGFFQGLRLARDPRA